MASSLCHVNLLLWHTGSVAVVRGLCFSMAFGILVPLLGIEPVSLALLLLLLSHFSRVRLCVTHQAPLSLGFSRQEH